MTYDAGTGHDDGKPTDAIKDIVAVTPRHIELGQVIQAAALLVTRFTAERIRCSSHHVGNGPIHFGLNKCILPTKGRCPFGFGSRFQRFFPIKTVPERVIIMAIGVGHQQMLVDGVIDLLTMHDFERPDARFAVAVTTLNTVDGDRLGIIDLIGKEGIVDLTVKPAVLRLQLLIPLKVALFGAVDDITILITGTKPFALLIELTGCGPIPHGFGLHTTTGDHGNVTGLTSDLIHMIIELGAGFVRCHAVARLTGGTATITSTRGIDTTGILGLHLVTATGDVMAMGGVTSGAAEVVAVDIHMDIEELIRLHQGGVHVAMFDPIIPTTDKVAAAAVATGGQAHTLCHFSQIHGLKRFTTMLGEEFFILLLFIAFGMSGSTGDFFIILGLIMTDQAVYILLLGKVIAVILPTITGMTGCTRLPVALGRTAEAVDHMLFTQQLASLLVFALPSPVLGFHHLLGRLGVAAQTRFGHLWAGVKRTLKLLKLTVVRSGFAGGFTRGGNLSLGKSNHEKKREQDCCPECTFPSAWLLVKHMCSSLSREQSGLLPLAAPSHHLLR
uniref:Uncharacterized protein n=1 Tax=Magnetococcus massalia (strain MO-1) TaxID=451514 RepID=A0A1S7LI98_MAGMO|nr:membrane protein of unknown function [Candidatus Magnetococcus massalia]